MFDSHPFIRGTLILTLAGFLSKAMGFFYRIFLSHTIGAEGLGIYHLIFPLHSLCMALTTSGIQTAISRFAAARSALKDTRGANDLFLGGCGLSFLLSLLAAVFLYQNAAFLGEHLLEESRCTPLLRLMACSLPLSTLHSCISGYYYARREAAVPAGLQLLEQTVRIGSSWLAWQILLAEGRPVTPVIAVTGMAVSEAAAALVSLLLLSRKFHLQNYRLRSLQGPVSHLRQIIAMAAPLTANRVLLTLLTSLETILIPGRLRLYGLGNAEALSVYGVLTGMALPLVFFPAAITNSVSVLLLPSVAQLQALGNRAAIRRNCLRILRCCAAMGMACTVLFFTFHSFFGTVLFHSALASSFLRSLAFICPFLYLNGMIASTLHGLGRTGTCFLHSIVSVSIRLLFVVFAIPAAGIRGYLWGILLGELALTVLGSSALVRYLQEK